MKVKELFISESEKRHYSKGSGTYEFSIELRGARFQKPDDLAVEMMEKFIPIKMEQMVPELRLSKLNVKRTSKTIQISARLYSTDPHTMELHDRTVIGRYDYDPEKQTQQSFKRFKENKGTAYGEMMLRKAIREGEIENL